MGIFSRDDKSVAARMTVMDFRRGINPGVGALVAYSKNRAKMMSATEKRKRRSSVLNHKTARNASWGDGSSTPLSANGMLKLITKGILQSRARYGTRDWSEATDQKNGSRHTYSPGTTNQDFAVKEGGLQQGIKTDPYEYVKALQMCLQQKDLLAAKQVHDCIIHNGLMKNPYVANTLLNVYIRCGGCADARRVFDEIEQKSVITWNAMIAGYARSDHADYALKIFSQMRFEGAQPNVVTYLSILKACTSPSALHWGKQVHVCIAHSGLESDVRVGTALLQMYAKCGCITEARRVFENLTNRNVITWNIMIGAYGEGGQGVEAYRLFLQMKRQGIEPDAFTYATILNSAGSEMPLEWVREVHAHARKAGLESDLRVCNALVHMYTKTGGRNDARLVFDRMEIRDVVTWNIIIGGLAQDGCGHEAYELFVQMRRQGFEPNAITYASILNASSASEVALEWVKKVHAHAVNAGLESDLRVGIGLVHMYAKSGGIDDALRVFNKMEKRDVVTWNVMIGGLAQHGWGHEAYRLFLQMKREGFEPDVITYVNILNAGASVGALEWVREVHGQARKAGLDYDLRVGNGLIHMYAKSGSLDDARLVFNRMDKRDVFTWNIMIGGLAQHGFVDEAYKLFLQMRREGLEPNAITYGSILNAPANVGALEWVKEVHAHARDAGLEDDLRVANALVHIYAQSGGIDDARLVFDRMEKRDIVTWNIMIGGLAQDGFGHEAYRLFLQMRREGFEPNAITFASILSASASVGALEWLKELHGHARKTGLESDLRVGNALLHMYAKTGSLDEARQFFTRMEDRDIVTWNIMIGALAEDGCGHEAYSLFLQMKREGFEPDAITYASILNASATVGALEWVKEVHVHACNAGLESDLRVGNALVLMYAKSGGIDAARLVFDKIEKRDVVTWNIMIGGLAQHGRGHEALELFNKMNADSVKPDRLSFAGALSACCHAGLLDDGRRLFLAMRRDCGIEPEILHYTCMVDLLGRAGLLEEAKLFISDMPVEPNDVTWKAFLGACRTYGDVELGELAAKALFKLEPKNSSAYVLLSNIYAAAGDWEKASSVRTMMHKRGVRKEPGRSWIEVDNKIHEFVSGDTSHREAKAIYSYIDTLIEKLKAEGYIPDTRTVLEKINEEGKERVLCSHSEKLAIAYGLIRIPRGKPIRIYKNLRVCSDCHTVTKLISKVTGREIMARDATRFHHFRDGVCSCGDYW